jgi:hypothetical protein
MTKVTAKSTSFWESAFWRRTIEGTALITALVALFAAVMAYRATEHSVQQQYVGLAISILKEPTKGQPDIDLRAWALVVFQKYSPVPLPANVAADLKAGAITLTSALGKLDDAARADLESAIKEAERRARDGSDKK